MSATAELSDLSSRALTIYQRKLQPVLEISHLGEFVAIHVASGNYALANSSPKARRLLRVQHPIGGIVTLEIGLPVTSEHQVPFSGAAVSRRSKQR